jgi:putative membrane protein
VTTAAHMTRIDFTLHNALTAWQWGPFPLLVLAALLAAASWYLTADWHLAARGRCWPRQRTVCFLAGLCAIDLALQSPISTFTATYFQAHVIQHLLLMVVAPPLLALSAPSTLLLQTASRSTKVRWLAVLRSRPFAALTHPITAWCLYFGAMLVFFLTPLINFAMEHMALMDTINLVFFFGGTLYWWPMIGVDPIIHWKMGYGARMANVLLGAPVEVWLGIAVMSDRRPIASMYTLAGTHAGGAMLWIATELGTLAGFLPIFMQWYRSDQREAARFDAHPERGMEGIAGVTGQRLPASKDGSRRRTAWEASWLAKTGSIPAQDAGPAAAGSDGRTPA